MRCEVYGVNKGKDGMPERDGPIDTGRNEAFVLVLGDTCTNGAEQNRGQGRDGEARVNSAATEWRRPQAGKSFNAKLERARPRKGPCLESPRMDGKARISEVGRRARRP